MIRTLPTVTVDPSQVLYHVSRIAYAGAALYFGRANNRYDDPDGQFGVMYLGMDLPTALMESVFHQHQWSCGERLIAPEELAGALVREVAVLDRLTVLDLNAPGLMAGQFGLNLHQLTSRDYAHTRSIAAIAHAERAIDGILYPSRNNYPGSCLALFDRCSGKLGLLADIALDRHRHWAGFADRYAIAVRPPSGPLAV